MPPRIRAILSVIVAVVALILFFVETDGTLKWGALVLGALLIGAAWLFPEGRPVKDRDR